MKSYRTMHQYGNQIFFKMTAYYSEDKQKIGSFHSKHEKSNQAAEQYLIFSFLNTASWSDCSLSQHPKEEITVFEIRLSQVVAHVVPFILISATLNNALEILISKNVYIRYFFFTF